MKPRKNGFDAARLGHRVSILGPRVEGTSRATEVAPARIRCDRSAKKVAAACRNRRLHVGVQQCRHHPDVIVKEDDQSVVGRPEDQVEGPTLVADWFEQIPGSDSRGSPTHDASVPARPRFRPRACRQSLPEFGTGPVSRASVREAPGGRALQSPQTTSYRVWFGFCSALGDPPARILPVRNRRASKAFSKRAQLAAALTQASTWFPLSVPFSWRYHGAPRLGITSA